MPDDEILKWSRKVTSVWRPDGTGHLPEKEGMHYGVYDYLTSEQVDDGGEVVNESCTYSIVALTMRLHGVMSEAY